MKKVLRTASAAIVTVGLSLLLFFPATVLSQRQDQASIKTADGVHQLTFSLAAGKIKVFLPDDMAAGDMISGTVVAEPAGRTDEEKAANDGILTGTVIDLGGSQRLNVPGRSLGSKINILPFVVNTKGRGFVISATPLGGSALTIPVPMGSAPVSVPSNFSLPAVGQSGHSSPISGPFDGDLRNTKCSLGTVPVSVIAESPRQSVFLEPKSVTGLAELQVNEGGRTATGSHRNVSVNLTAPKTNLIRGEKTVVTVQVSGLQGITEPLPLHLITTGTVKMQGGNVQTIEIDPQQVLPNGTYSRPFDLTGTSSGSFTVTGTVAEPQAGGKEKCKCNCEFAKPAITSDTKRSDGGGTENTFSPNMKRADCTGSKCSVQGISYSWSIGGNSTATYKIREGTDKSGKLIVEVSKGGTLVITVTVTVTCSDGTKCSDTATETITVK